LTIIGSIIRNTMGWLSNHEAWAWRVPSDLVWAKTYCSRCETCTNSSFDKLEQTYQVRSMRLNIVGK
jgi:hypothetical protein